MKILSIVCTCLLWFFWLAFVSAIILYQIFLTGDTGESRSLFGVFPLSMLLVPAGVCAIIRWLLIPRWRNPLIVLVLAIAGIAVADSISLYGIFLFSNHRLVFLIVAVLSLVQFVPLGLFRREG